MTVRITRRRAITVLAAVAGVPLLLKAGKPDQRMVEWTGYTLGAPSTIRLYHTDERAARAAIDAGLAELTRLENIFSLYKPDSVISRLNREGAVDNAPAEFVEMLNRSLAMAKITDGAFDPTVQPLWQTYFRHFTAATVDPAGPSKDDIARAVALVGWRGVEVDAARGRVALARPGMGLTLNSGAQGYITDKVADVLKSRGFEHMLVDLDHPRAISTKPDGSAWKIGVANPAKPSEAITQIEVVDRAVGGAGGYGTIFDEAGRFTHIMDPRTGATIPAMIGASVVARTALVADGVATAMLLVEPERRRQVLKDGGGELAILVTPEGVVSRIEA